MKEKNKLKNLIRAINTPDSYLVLAYAFLLIIGIWHAFPNLKVVGDEAPFVGGVLRAIQAKTFLPNIDYSYTVSFYANYILTIPFLAILLAVFGGSYLSVVHFLAENVYVAYFIPRLVTVFSSVTLLVLFLKMMRDNGRNFFERFAVSAIVFGNIIFFVIAHTGKMWILSLLLWFLSFYFFDKAISSIDKKEKGEEKTIYSPLFWSPVFAFLAFANFPINIISFVFVVWLGLLVFIKGLPSKPILLGTIFGAFLFGLFFLLNHTGWEIQNSITPISTRNYHDIFLYFFYGFLTLVPIQILYFIFCTKIQKFNQQIIALIVMCMVYVGLIVFRAPWVGDLSGGYLRYFTYIVFFLGAMSIYLSSHRKIFAFILSVVSLAFVLRVDYLLAVPTTYNLARDYLVANAGPTLIVNDFAWLDLPKNTEASIITKDSACQSRCLYSRSNDDISNGLFVIDLDTKEDDYKNVFKNSPSQFLVSTSLDKALPVVYLAKNALSDGKFSAVDSNLGQYSFNLFLMNRLGPNISIYKVLLSK